MSLANRIFLLLVVGLCLVGCDQATKMLASFALKGAPPLVFSGNLFRLEYAENPGAFLGLGANLPDLERWLLLTVASGLILLLMTIFVCIREDLGVGELGGYALILAGGFSNMIDRVASGVVVDFMNVGFGNWRTGIFNVADMAIMLGLFVVMAAHFLVKPGPTVLPSSIDKRG